MFARVREWIESGHAHEIRLEHCLALTHAEREQLSRRMTAESAHEWLWQVQPWTEMYHAYTQPHLPFPIDYAYEVTFQYAVWKAMYQTPPVHSAMLRLRFGLGCLSSWSYIQDLYSCVREAAFYAWRLSDQARQVYEYRIRSDTPPGYFRGAPSLHLWDAETRIAVLRCCDWLMRIKDAAEQRRAAECFWQRATPAARHRLTSYLDTRPVFDDIHAAFSRYQDRMRYEVTRMERHLTQRVGRDVANLIGQYVSSTIPPTGKRRCLHTDERDAKRVKP